MKRNWVKPISCALALALTVGSFPGSVLAATSAQQAFEMTVQSVMEAANVTTDASTEKVTYQVTAGVAYGKGTIKIISGATEATNEDGEKYYAADKDSVITIEVAPESRLETGFSCISECSMGSAYGNSYTGRRKRQSVYSNNS